MSLARTPPRPTLKTRSTSHGAHICVTALALALVWFLGFEPFLAVGLAAGPAPQVAQSCPRIGPVAGLLFRTYLPAVYHGGDSTGELAPTTTPIVDCPPTSATPTIAPRTRLGDGPGQDQSVTARSVTFPGFQLDGTTHHDLVAPADGPWRVTDASTSNSGWYVTVAAGDFIAGERRIPVSGFDIRLHSGAIDTISGTAVLTPTLTTFSPLSTDGVRVLEAGANAGGGAYEFTPDFSLDVPADAYAGDYSATLMVTVISGPL